MTEVVPFEEKDYLAEARENVTQQFKNKDVFDRYLQLLLYHYNSVQGTLKDLAQNRSIDQAKGAQLDIIGRIVGQPRETILASVIEYFGFSPNLLAHSFGTVKDPVVGGRFRSINESLTTARTFTDEEYRFFIKAKIIKNVGKGTIEDMIRSVKFILDNINVVFVEEDPDTIGPAAFNLGVDRALTITEGLILTESNIIPKPAGVKLNLQVAIGEPGWGNNWGYDWGGTYG